MTRSKEFSRRSVRGPLGLTQGSVPSHRVLRERVLREATLSRDTAEVTRRWRRIPVRVAKLPRRRRFRTDLDDPRKHCARRVALALNEDLLAGR